MIKEKILYGGCIIKRIENNNPGNIAEANVPAWSRSVKNVMQKFPGHKCVITGHYGWTNNKALEHTLQLLENNNKN